MGRSEVTWAERERAGAWQGGTGLSMNKDIKNNFLEPGVVAQPLIPSLRRHRQGDLCGGQRLLQSKFKDTES